MFGTCVKTYCDLRNATREKLPIDNIAATCNPITSIPPTTAAAICATILVRFGPMTPKSWIVSTIPNAVLVSETAIKTP
jgi:hypothetical protein